jgi:DEAD/DEAH box helicase domain-containing protein
MAETSRGEAILLFSKILKEKNKIETTKSIEDVDVRSLLDSELEVRFIKSLERIKTIQGSKIVKHHIVNGKPGWLFTIGDKEKKQEYTIEPQVWVGEELGVSIRSKVDFIVRPIRSSSKMKPIAIFTDGFSYHRDRLDKDTAQRMALLHSGRFNVWSIPWWDVESVFSEQSDYCSNYLLPSRAKLGANIGKFSSGFGAPVELNSVHEKTSLEMLVMYLSNPDVAGWRTTAGIYAAIHCDKDNFDNPNNRTNLFDLIESLQPNKFSAAITRVNQGMWGVLKDENSIPEVLALSKFVSIDNSGFKPPLAEDCIRVCLHINDGKDVIGADRFKNVWAGFLKQINLFQFLPHFYFTSQLGVQDDIYAPIIPLMNLNKGLEEKANYEHALSGISDLVSEDVINIVIYILNSGGGIPVVGFEFENDRGVIVAEAELAWPDKKVALIYSSQWDIVNKIKLDGWKLAKLEDALAAPTSVKKFFE